MRSRWFAWLAAHEEGDAALAASKVEDIARYAQKIGIRRLTDLSVAATLLARREIGGKRVGSAIATLDAAVKLDPDLPEPRWARVGVAARALDVVGLARALPGAVRASLVDVETRRIVAARASLLVVLALGGVGLAFVLLLAIGAGPRLLHDLGEVAARVLSPQASRLVAVGLLLLPLLLSLDVVWLLLTLFVLSFGYAERPQQAGAAVALLPLLLILPVTDRVSYELAVSASPVVRGAEALAEKRYDQRLLDDLEGLQGVIPDDADVRFLLGCLYQSLGQNDRAVAEYTVAAQSSPSEVRALVNRGNIRFVDGDFGSAQEDFQEAIRRDPRCVAARYNLSLVYAETFRTIEAGQALSEARALDADLVAAYQERSSLVKVVSLRYTEEEARAKLQALSKDPRSRRYLGHWRSYDPWRSLRLPVVLAVPLAIVAALWLHRRREGGRGYALSCQKCGRTFCRRCKPPEESPGLCSQCVHVYLKKDGVSIETKLQKVEEVKRRQTAGERLRFVANLFLPGASAFAEGRPVRGAAVLGTFLLCLFAALFRTDLASSPRPGAAPLLLGTALWGLLALGTWILGQRPARRA